MHQTLKSTEKILFCWHYSIFKSKAVKGYNATMGSWTVCVHCNSKCSTWLV